MGFTQGQPGQSDRLRRKEMTLAKITARGAHAVERHERQNGTEYLLTSDGVILRKLTPSHGWSTVQKPNWMSNTELWAYIKQLQ